VSSPTNRPTSPAPPPPTAERAFDHDLFWLARRLSRALGALQRAALSSLGLNLWGHMVLTEVAANPARTQLALARATGTDKSKMVAILDELEAAGLITRRPDPADRRARIVSATDEGRRALTAATAEIRQIETDLLATLSGRKREDLRHALQTLVTGPLHEVEQRQAAPIT